MLIAPYSETFTTEYDKINGDWVTNYALSSFEFAIVIITIISLLILIPRIERSRLRKISITILCLLSGVALLIAFQSLSMPIQDFSPQWGMLILIILFPIVAIDSLMEWKRHE